MLEFIKMFGLGILYTILFPFIVVIFAIALVYVFVNYLVNESIHVFGFFFGHTFSEETELEKKLNAMKEEKNVSEEESLDAGEVTYTYNEETSEQKVADDVKGSDNDELH